jgi:hypothetical protein
LGRGRASQLERHERLMDTAAIAIGIGAAILLQILFSQWSMTLVNNKLNYTENNV